MVMMVVIVVGMSVGHGGDQPAFEVRLSNTVTARPKEKCNIITLQI